MRASFLVLGSLLAKYRKAVISLPGGCKIGTRPVDMHLDALVKMGAEISLDQGYVNASVQRRLHGATINFEKNSVGATQNLLIAAALAKGTTVIKNAAQEPEITDLANFICMLGGEIYGAGTSEIIIEGKEELEGGTYEVMPDRIEAATYAIAAIVTKGNLILTNCYNDSLNNFEEFLERSNIEVVRDDHSNIMHINATNAEIRSGHFVTNPFPELATDLQAQVIAMLALGDGISTVTENIFENRFNHVFELKRMNANIEVDHNIATIHGKKILQGAEVMATDLRASASLVIAGLAAEGQTTVNKIHHLDRGYENLEKKLTACGADIQRISSDLLENQISCSM
jgi:UDP-N-acetylglucosamine 1-carboxyvinyltransferase